MRESPRILSLVRELYARGEEQDGGSERVQDEEEPDGSMAESATPEKEIAGLARRIDEILFDEAEPGTERD